MNPTSPPEPLFTFTYPNLGYSIVIIPHSAADRTKLQRQSESGHLSLQDYCRDTIIDSMVLAEFE